MRHIVNLSLARLCSIFPHYLINGAFFFGKKQVIEHKTGFDFLYNVCLEHFTIFRRVQRDIKNVY